MNYYKLLLLLTLSIVTLNSCKQPQLIDDNGFVTLNAFETRHLEDGSVSIALTYDIKEGFHIQLFKVEQDNVIPTEVRIVPSDTFKIRSINPLFKTKTLSFNENTKLKVIDGKLTIHLIVEHAFNNNLDIMTVGLWYQACNDKQCYYPRILETDIALP